MAYPSLPSTPQSQSPAVDNQSPGKWRHPRLNEIVRRQNAATFDDRNVKKLLGNGGAMLTTLFLESTLKSYVHRLALASQFSVYPDLILVVLRFFFLINIVTALYPLFRPKDDLSDIPLTPTQRALLGLDPKSSPPTTPGTQYATPPKYRLSSRAGSPASRSMSPLSASESPAGRRASFSPTASPLFQRAVSNGHRESSRRQSFGSSSPSLPLRDSSLGRLPATPSPVGTKGSKLGLSNKWLYEKSRRQSAGNSLT